MDKEKIELLHSLTIPYFQKQKYYPDRKSMLPVDIQEVTGCTPEQAWDWAAKYCNLHSWHSTNRASGNTEMSFKEYLGKMITTKVIDPETKKEVLCKCKYIICI